MADGSDLKSMLFEVIQHPADRRAGEVDRLCAGNESVRRELWSLVQAWDRATAVLQDPAPMHVPAPVRDLTGERAGPFVLKELLGEGGFGLVYRAQQESPVRRAVAVKVLKPGMDSRSVLARFDAERRALAMLAHDSIARIYDAGERHDGRPYFAMELIEGRPITGYCDAHRMGVRERIELFVRVCDAVHHAHQKGIIHRDLKPSNILVQETERGPTPKVIDFGIAKAIEEPISVDGTLTLAQQVVGTPLYMSPEQASGDGAVDTRSDVYSLGAVLYELLCGSTPIDAETLTRRGLSKLGEAIRAGGAVRPSTRAVSEQDAAARDSEPTRLRRTLAGDLDWIVMRAIEGEPDRRYASAAALARDLRRHLASEPVEARPPTAVYLAGRFARRHRAGVAIACVSAAALIALVAVLAVSLQSVRAQRDVALVAQANEAQAREDADGTLAYFLEVLMAPSGDRMGRDATVLDAIEASADTIDERTQGQPALAARVHNATSIIYREVGQPEAALEHVDRAIELTRSTEPVDTVVLVSILNDRALVLDDMGDYEGFRRTLEEAVEIAERAFGPDDRTTLVPMANLAGNVWIREGRAAEAAEVLERVVSRGADEIKDETRFSAMNNLGYAYAELGRDDDAAAWYQRLLDETEASGGQWNAKRLGAFNNLAGIRFRAEEYEGALAAFRGVLAEIERQSGELSPNVLVSLNNIASAEQKLGRLDDALATRDEAKRRADLMLPEGHPAFAQLLVGRGTLLVDMGRTDEAERAFLDSYALFERLGAPRDVTAHSAQMLSDLYEKLGRAEDASVWATRAKPVPDEALP